MTRPIAPMFFVGVFLLIVICAVLMLGSVMMRGRVDGETTEVEMAAPREAVARQLMLLKHGDIEALRPTFATALRTQVTADLVRRSRPAYADRSLDDLVGTVEVEEVAGARIVVVRRPDGTELTRLVATDGIWLADRIWFAAP